MPTNYSQTISASVVAAASVSAAKAPVFGDVSVVWSLPAKVDTVWGPGPAQRIAPVFQQVFTRKNVLTITAQFSAADGSTTQPTSAIAVVNYRSAITAGAARVVANIPLAYVAAYTTTDANGNTISAGNWWTGTWDTSPAAEGVVEWMVFGEGSLQAAMQGRFQLLANLANQATP